MKKLLTLFLILFSIPTFISAKENSTVIGNKEKKLLVRISSELQTEVTLKL